MVKGSHRTIYSAYLLGQCLGPLEVGLYYVRHVKAEQVSAPKRLTCSLSEVEEERIRYKPNELAVEVRLRYDSKTHWKLFKEESVYLGSLKSQPFFTAQEPSPSDLIQNEKPVSNTTGRSPVGGKLLAPA